MKANFAVIENALKNKGTIAFAPYGDSMWPFIKNHASSVVIETLKGELNLYDVILFKREDGALVLHRIIGLGENYVVSGDSILQTEKVKKAQILGVMTAFYKGKKMISSSDTTYLEKVKKWYENENRRKRKIKFFYFRKRLQRKILKIFKGKKNV